MGMISCSDSWQGQRFISCVQHTVLGPPSQYQGLFLWWSSGQDTKLTIQLYWVLRLIVHGVILSFPHMSPWYGT